MMSVPSSTGDEQNFRMQHNDPSSIKGKQSQVVVDEDEAVDMDDSVSEQTPEPRSLSHQDSDSSGIDVTSAEPEASVPLPAEDEEDDDQQEADDQHSSSDEEHTVSTQPQQQQQQPQQQHTAQPQALDKENTKPKTVGHLWDVGKPRATSPGSKQKESHTGKVQKLIAKTRKQNALVASTTGQFTNIRKVTLTSDKGFGFSIVGSTRGAGKDALSGVFISKVATNGVADLSGWIFPGDQLLSVNRTSVVHATHLEAISVLKTAGEVLELELASNPEGFQRYQSVLPELRQIVPRVGTEVVTENGQTKFAPVSADQKAIVKTPEPPSMVALHSSLVSTELDNELVHVRLGQAYLEEGDFEKAEHCFLQALHPTIDESLARSLVDASKAKSTREAQEKCNLALQHAKESKAGVHYLLGLALSAQGRLNEAQTPFIACVQQCLPWYYFPGVQMDPDDGDFHYNVACALCTQNKFEQARTAFQAAIRHKPNEQWAIQLARLDARLAEENGVAAEHLHALV
eukprot:m.7439 g.7439  ORF g.7439 m.7439 type:complete len:516 (+) comp2944_c0_seq1:297-1844(+)